MYAWEELRDKVNLFIDNLKFEREPRELYAPIRYTLEQSGKRVRPVLFLMAYNLYKESVEDALYPAVAMETYHNYTLIHDDVMDRAGLPLIGIVPDDPNVTLAAAFGKPLLKHTKKGAAAAFRRITSRIQGLHVPITL